MSVSLPQGLPTGPFAVVYADPPWRFDSWSDKMVWQYPDWGIEIDNALAAEQEAQF